MRFEPEQIDVRRGDVVRFVQEGIMPHNVQFVRNSAPAGVDIGDNWTGPYLTKSGETYEVAIDDRFVDGEYEIVCVPHLAMGMQGGITVEGGTTAATSAPAADIAARPASSLPRSAGFRAFRIYLSSWSMGSSCSA